MLANGRCRFIVVADSEEDAGLTFGSLGGAIRKCRADFGVEIDNMEEARARIEKAGAVHRPYPGTEEMAKRGNVEVKFTGPDGVTIDLSEHGWLGTK